MFYINVKTTAKNADNLKKIQKKAEELSKKIVAIGFPKGKLNAPHYEGEKGKPGPSIIDVAIWNNFGIGVPRRDFMTPATKKWKEFTTLLADEFKEKVIEDKMEIETLLELAGQKGADIVSEEIIKLRTPPNSPATIERKKSSNPLVDSGDMSKAPTYKIRTVEK